VLKLLLFCLAAQAAFSAGWEAVQRIQPDTRIEVRTREHQDLRGTFVSANATALVLRSKTGEQSIARDEIRRVLVADPSRRFRNMAITAAVGAGIGLAIGAAICPYCPNEGAGWKYMGPLTSIGAGAGAAGGLLQSTYRTLYKSK